MTDNNPITVRQKPAVSYTYVWIALSLMATILVAGVVITESVQNFLNDNARQTFLARTKIAATGIKPALVAELTANQSDVLKEPYQQLKRQLTSIKDASVDMRFVYLMGQQEKEIVFLVDAEPRDSEDYSPPGQVYPNPSDQLREIFQSGQAFVEGPIRDEWGTWISGHAPIIDTSNGKVLAIIGIDIDAHAWERTVHLYRWGSIGVVLVLLTLVLLYFLSLWRISHANAERRHTANQLESVVAELRDTNQELESFSYSVSHDLRAPLRHIQGYSEALEEDFYDKLGENGLNYLQRLRHAAQSMDRLILGLLKLSRVGKQDLNINRVNLSALAHEIIQDLNKEYDDKVYETEITQDMVCFGDSRLLRIVLENLFTNAYKYSQHAERPRIEFGATQVDGKTVYFVKDNGIGFDMDYQEKLFEPFQRLHPTEQFEGSGIGLSTVARIVRRHKGRIWAEGKPNEGAAFYFTVGLII